MIRHTVVFRLKHKSGSAEEKKFLADARRILTAIPGVTRFEALRQTNRKNGNDYAFGLSMEFADQPAYEAYDRHPDHVAFVRDRWLTEVEKFFEIDYAAI